MTRPLIEMEQRTVQVETVRRDGVKVVQVTTRGAPGPAGVVAATAPLTYNSATKALALSLGSGLSVVDGALVVTGGSGDGGATDLGYNQATRTLSSSTGADVVLPLATDALDGLMSAAQRLLTQALIGAGVQVDGTAVVLPHIHGDLAGGVYIHVKNTSGAQLAKGVPVRVTGAVGDTTTLEVAAADSASAGTMPAIGILADTLAVNATGHATVAGELTGLNTSGYSIGQALYVAAGGGLTGTRPTTGTVQKIAIVGRVHANTGSITATITASLHPVAYSGAYADLSGKPSIPAAADAAPQPLGTAAIGASADYAREDHVHKMPSAGDVGADPAGAAVATVSGHVAAADPHTQYALESSLATVATSGAYGDLSGRPTLGTAAPLDVAAAGDASASQVVKGNDSRLTDARTPTAHTQAANTISDSTTAGRALLTAADAPAQREALGLGSLATQNGTFSGTSSGTNTGDVTLAASVADILNLSGQELQADDPGGDRLLFWDDSEGKLTHAAVGPGIVFDGTTLRAEDSPWMALGDESTAATSGIKLTVHHWPSTHRLTAIPIWSATAPVTSALQVDIRVGGATIFSTLPTIAAGGTSSTTTTPAVFSAAFVSGGQQIAAGSVVTFHVTQPPAGGGGAGLKVHMPAVRI